ncbi:transcription antitermination factor NusB [Candidatus Saganbacteria bacterium]|uniref:Transcription antitermination protein NusB n=1 Tax=Candidatus Saganbacteria bacterium TaxID=2575572 RepID=A0A9D6UM12_UNCSA|nr:transcription antitermination factor NusB [Candidatus Saganbacteria bacterium]
MGKRSTSRRLAMQAIYQAEVAGVEISEAIKNVFESEKFIPETTRFARNLAQAAWEEREASDKIIAGLAIDWSLDRIGKVDRSILRLALQELKEEEIPPSVIIDEAVEMAKKYSSLEAAKFINGILGAYLEKARGVC